MVDSVSVATVQAKLAQAGGIFCFSHAVRHHPGPVLYEAPTCPP